MTIPSSYMHKICHTSDCSFSLNNPNLPTAASTITVDDTLGHPITTKFSVDRMLLHFSVQSNPFISHSMMSIQIFSWPSWLLHCRVCFPCIASVGSYEQYGDILLQGKPIAWLPHANFWAFLNSHENILKCWILTRTNIHNYKWPAEHRNSAHV